MPKSEVISQIDYALFELNFSTTIENQENETVYFYIKIYSIMFTTYFANIRP